MRAVATYRARAQTTARPGRVQKGEIGLQRDRWDKSSIEADEQGGVAEEMRWRAVEVLLTMRRRGQKSRRGIITPVR